MRFDPIALLERAYQQHRDSSAWLQAMTESVVEAVEPSSPAAISYVLGSGGAEQPMAVVPDQVDLESLQGMVALGWTMSTPENTRKVMAACSKPGINSLRQILGDGPVDVWLERCRDRPVALADAVAVVLLPGLAGKPILLTIASAQPRMFQESEQALWLRIAIHLSAGWRLSGRASDVEAEDVEAAVSAEGQVVEARGSGKTRAGRELLRQAAQDIDRARSRRGRSDPLAALQLWQGLLAGRWSLVEHFDSDGRRFMLARRNDPCISDPAALTRRQRQVVFYASLGLSNKETAYALGLAENTISAHLAAGLARLGIASRAHLIRTSSELTSEALMALAAS